MSTPTDPGTSGHPTVAHPPPLMADPIIQSLAFTVAVSAVFLLFPGIDQWFTGLFYDPDTGFPMGRLTAFNGLRDLNDWILIATGVVLVGAVLVKLAWPERPILIPPAKMVFLTATLALGPGLVVNAIFKTFWGRPRPVMVEAFGGDAPFVEVWRITDYCSMNCSFVSGEASSAIWMLGLAVLAPPRWQWPAVKAIAVLAVLLSLNRVAFGGHFLSDVLLAWGMTAFIMAVVYRYTIETPPTWLENQRLEHSLVRLSGQIRERLTALTGPRR